MTYQEFKEAVIGHAKEQGLADYELYYAESESTTVEIYKEEVKGYSTEGSMGICFRCILNDKAGYASTENLTEEEAQSLVLRAVENAGCIESEEKTFLHKAGDSYGVLPENKEEAPAGTELVEAALKLQKEMYQADPRVSDGTQSYVAYGKEKYALYNSNGLDLEDNVAYAQAQGFALVSQDGEMYDGSKDMRGSLKNFDLKDIAEKAVEDAVSTIGAGGVKSGKYTVVFGSRALATLLAAYSNIFSAEAVQKGMSLLKDKEGEKIASDIVTLVDDPMYKDSCIKRTFDGEGVATYAKNVVEKGVLTTLLHNLKTAAKAGVRSTGNASKASYAATVGISPFTFYLQPVEGTKEDFFAEAGEGIYITEVTGLHAGANPITGDFSLSSSGFMIEGGKKGRPVKSFTVSGNFFDLLKKIEKVGADLEFLRGKWGAPSVLVRDMAIAGK